METINEWALTNLVNFGAPALLILAFIGSLGIPFPVTMVIIAAGAFSRIGYIDWRLAFIACWIGAVLADHSEYLMGRTIHQQLAQRFGQKLVWRQAQKQINQNGGWAVMLTRFWFTPLAPAVNIIAGSRYPYGAFLFFDLLGQFLWVLLYGGLGYGFASQWELVNQAASGFSILSMVLVVILFFYYYLFRFKRAQ